MHARARFGSTGGALLLAVGAVGGLAGGVLDSALGAGPAAASGVVLVDEPFTGSTTASPNWVVPSAPDGDNLACLTGSTNGSQTPIPGCDGYDGLSADTSSPNALQLTYAGGGEEGGVAYGLSVPSSDGIDANFDAYQYDTNGSGSAADGIGFFLAAANPNDPQAPASIGQPGGALGYSASGGSAGMTDGYLGVGLDVFGNYANTSYEGSGCTNPGWDHAQLYPKEVSVRGPGNNTTGYCMLASTASSGGFTGTLDSTSNTTRSGSSVPVEVVVNPGSVSETTASGLTVGPESYEVAFTPLGGSQQTLSGTLPSTSNGGIPSGTIPSSWINPSTGIPYQFTFGWVGSTGGDWEYHAVNDVTEGTLSGDPPALSTGVVTVPSGSPPHGSTLDYEVSVSDGSGAGNENDAVTVSDTIPSGETPQPSGLGGSGWSCSISGQAVSCTNNGPVDAGSSLPTLTIPVTVTAAAGTQITDTATASSDDADPSSGSDTVTVTKTPTSFTASAVPSSTSYGTSVILSATGLPAGATGTVTFTTTGSTTLCGPATVSSGSASCSTAMLVPGSYPVTGTYSGDATYASSTASTSFVITTFTPAVTVAVDDAGTGEPWSGSETTGATAYATSTVQSTGLTAPTGTLTYDFYANTTCSGSPSATDTQTLVGGTVPRSATVGPLGGGPYSFEASYSGDSNYSSSASSCSSFTVSKAAPTVSGAVDDQSTQNAWSGTEVTGASAYDTATVSAVPGFTPTGTVVYALYGDATCSGSPSSTNVQTLSGGSVPRSSPTAALAAGSYSYQATYSGDGNYLSRTGACQSFSVARGTPSVGSVTDDGSTDGAWSGSEYTGATAYDTATVSGAPGVTPSGTVTYDQYSDGNCTGTPSNVDAVTLSAGAVPNSGTTAPLGAGAYSFLATYSGDGNYVPVTGSCEAFTVNKATTTTTLTVAPEPSTYGQTLLTATITQEAGSPAHSATGTVDFELDGGGFTGCTAQVLSNDQATCSLPIPAGDHTMTVVYSGDANFLGSTSSPVFVGVNEASTTITVSTSPTSPVTVGQPVTITAVVAVVAPGTGNPPGWVNFSNGTTPLCSNVPLATVSGQWEAQCTVSTLPVGTASLIASYNNSDGNYLQSSNAASPDTLVVVPASTSTTLSSTSDPAVTDQPVTFTATVASSGGGTPTGTVTFKVDGATVCSTVSVTAGQAQCVVADLTAAGGPYTVDAYYSGDSQHAASDTTASPLVETVGTAATSTTVTSSANPSVSGQPVTFTATVAAATPGGGTPGGSVVFDVNGSPACLSGLDGSGQATCSVSDLTAGGGPFTVVADYLGSPDYGASTSATFDQNVDAASTTTTLASSADPSLYGQPVTLTATVATVSPGSGVPAGSVTFTADGTAVLCASVALSGGAASCSTDSLGAGTHLVVASYAGSTVDAASSSSSFVQGVNQDPTATSLVADDNPQSASTPITFTVTVAPVAPGTLAPTGTVNVSDGTVYLCINVPLNASGQGTCVVSAGLAPGNHTIVASYNGDGNFRQSSGSTVEVVGSTTTSLAVTTSPVTYGEPVAFAFTIDSPVGPEESGTVTVTSSQTGSTPLCSTSVLTVVSEGEVEGSCTDTSVLLLPGAITFTATYSGDPNFQGSVGPVATTVAAEPTSTSVEVAAPVDYGEPVTFDVSLVAGDTNYLGETPGPVSVTDGTNTLCSVSNWSEDTAGTFTGSCADTSILEPVGDATTFTASFAGDADLIGSSGTVTPTIGAEPTSLALSVLTASPTYGGAVEFQAVLTAGDTNYIGETPGPVAVTGPGGGTVCTVSAWSEGPAGTFTGTCTEPVAMEQAGSETYGASFAGDGDLAGSSTSVTTTIAQDSTSVAVSSNTDTATYGAEQEPVFTVLVSTGNGEPVLPGETVTVDVGGANCEATLFSIPGGGIGWCSLGSTDLGAGGPYPVSASYDGDVDLLASGPAVAEAGFTVAPDTTTVSVSSSTSDATYGAEQVPVFTVTVSTGNGEPLPGPETVTVDVGEASCQATITPGDGGGSGSCSLDPTDLGAGGPYPVSVSYPGDGDLDGSGPAFAASDLEVAQDSSSTTVVVAPSSVTYGAEQDAVFTVNVSTTNGEPLQSGDSATVQVGTASCVATLVPGEGGGTGTCSIASTDLSPGVYSVTASFSGDGNVAGSSITDSSAFAVTQDSTTTSVQASPSTATYGGESATVFTVTVSTGDGEPLPGPETVTVDVGDASCPVDLVPGAGGASGSCSIGDFDLDPGTYRASATYGGDAALTGSSGSTGLTVTPDTTTLTLEESTSTVTYGNESTEVFTVTLTTGHGEALAGPENVTVDVGGASCVVTLTPGGSGGAGSCRLTDLALGAGGPDTPSVSYGGDSVLAGSGPVTAAGVTVDKAGSSVGSFQVVPATVSYGGETAVVFTVTVDSGTSGTPTGTVTISQGTTTLCTVTLSGGTGSCSPASGSLLAPGSDTVTANYGGDANFDGSNTTSSLTVTKGTSTTTLSVGPGSAVVGQSTTLTVTLNGSGSAVPAGTISITFTTGTTTTTVCSGVSVSVSGHATCITAPGAVESGTYTATYSGDADYTGSSGSASQSVGMSHTQTSVASNGSPSVDGQLVTFTATVTVTAPGSATPTAPAGTVTFTEGSTTLCAAVALNGSGHALCTARINPLGAVTVSAAYSGNTNFTGSSGSVTQQTITGYWEVGADGGVFSFGATAFHGSMAGHHLNQPIIGIVATPDGQGYWLFAADGGVFSFGDASFYGSTGSMHLNAPVVGMVATADGHGYWLVAADGGVFSFGDAPFFGSAGSIHLNAPVVGMVATADGLGYWLVAADGGVFAYGDAHFAGASLTSSTPIIGLAATPDDQGYWLVTAAGNLYPFGTAISYGSPAGGHLNAPIVAIVATPDGKGYWLVGSDGGVYAYGDAPYDGSMGGTRLNSPIVGVTRL